MLIELMCIEYNKNQRNCEILILNLSYDFK